MEQHSTTRARWPRLLPGLLVVVVTLAAVAPVFPMAHEAHEMACCATASGCHGPAWSGACCAPPPAALAVPSAPYSWHVQHAAQADLLQPSLHLPWFGAGPLSEVGRDAFVLALLALLPEPPYLLNGSFLI
jgi:hypothetical protein